MSIHVTMVLMVSDITCAMNMYWTTYVLRCLLQTLPNLTCVRPRTIQHTLLRKANNYCVLEVETYCNIILCSWLLSTKRAKHGHSLLVLGATPEYPAFTLIILILLAQIGTWRRVLFSLPKGGWGGGGGGGGGGTDTVLSQVQSLGLRIKSFNNIDLQKTLSFRKCLSPSRKRTATFSSRKNEAWHGPVIAVFTKCFQNWRYTTETESTNCETTSPDGKLVKHPTKKLAVRGGGGGGTLLLKLHYQIRLSGYTVVCDAQPHPRSSTTDWRVQITSVLLSLLASWTYKYPVGVAGDMKHLFPPFYSIVVSSRISVDTRTGIYGELPTAKTSTAMMPLYRHCTGSDLSNSTHFSVILSHFRMKSVTWQLEPKW